jgi:hypothetical protein
LFWFRRKSQRTLIKNYGGQARMTEAEAIELIGRTLTKLNYPTNLVHIGFAPKILKPSVPGIPRYLISWEHLNATKDDIESTVEAEVDADKGVLKSFYFDNQAYWGKPPPIDVPIALRRAPTTNASNATPAKPNPPQRPSVPFELPWHSKKTPWNNPALGHASNEFKLSPLSVSDSAH